MRPFKYFLAIYPQKAYNLYRMPTVVELKALAKKRKVTLPHNASKDEIIQLLNEKANTMEKENHKTDSPHKSEKTEQHSAEKGKSKGETRSFQTGPDPVANREDLTREEAEKKGHYWGDIESREAGRSDMVKAPPGHEVAK